MANATMVRWDPPPPPVEKVELWLSKQEARELQEELGESTSGRPSIGPIYRALFRLELFGTDR